MERRYWRERRSVNVSTALGGILEGLDSRGSLQLVRLWDNWAEVVGEEVASLAKPLGKRGKALILQTDDPMTSQHLSFLVPEILGAIHRFLGKPFFEDIRFELGSGRPALDRPRPAPPKPASRIPKRPEALGSKAAEIDPNTPWGRAYHAYIMMFEDDENTSD